MPDTKRGRRRTSRRRGGRRWLFADRRERKTEMKTDESPWKNVLAEGSYKTRDGKSILLGMGSRADCVFFRVDPPLPSLLLFAFQHLLPFLHSLDFLDGILSPVALSGTNRTYKPHNPWRRQRERKERKEPHTAPAHARREMSKQTLIQRERERKSGRATYKREERVRLPTWVGGNTEKKGRARERES